MSDTAADGLIETAMKIRIYRDPTHPDQRPLRPPTAFRHTYNFSRQINRSKRAAAVRYCGELYHSNIVTAAATYDRFLWNGLEKNLLQDN